MKGKSELTASDRWATGGKHQHTPRYVAGGKGNTVPSTMLRSPTETEKKGQTRNNTAETLVEAEVVRSLSFPETGGSLHLIAQLGGSEVDECHPVEVDAAVALAHALAELVVRREHDVVSLQIAVHEACLGKVNEHLHRLRGVAAHEDRSVVCAFFPN